MAQTLGFILGIFFVAVTCGAGSYLIWEKYTQDQHPGKKKVFAIFSFLMGGALGLLSGFAVLIISLLVARLYRTHDSKTDQKEKDKAA